MCKINVGCLTLAFIDQIKGQKRFTIHFGEKIGKLEKKMYPLKDGFVLQVIYKVHENEKGIALIYNRYNVGKLGDILVMSVNLAWSLSFLITETPLLWI